MPDLNFKIEKAHAVPYAVAPLLNFSLQITDHESPPTRIHAVTLRCQLRIEPNKRKYDPAEKESLLDLFGEPARWGQTLKPLLWQHANVTVPAFTQSVTVDMPVPCTYDFNLAASKFFYSLQDGEVPLCLLFSGTIFYEAPDQPLQIAQIPWEKETNFRLPVQVWKQMMDIYYPNSAWLCLRKDAFQKLYRYKSSRSLPTWEAAIDSLLDQADEEIPI